MRSNKIIRLFERKKTEFLMNAGKEPKAMKINLSNFKNIVPSAEKTVFSGDANAENALENPKMVVTKSDFSASTNFEYETSAMSLTVIRMSTK